MAAPACQDFSAGVSLLSTIRADDSAEKLTAIPLVRDPRTRKELNAADFNRWLGEKLTAAGLGEFAAGGRALGIGGATTLGELEGEEAALNAGEWRSRG